MFKCWSDRGFGGCVASVWLLGYPQVLHFIKLDFLNIEFHVAFLLRKDMSASATMATNS